MAGRPRRIRSIQSYINNIDAHTFAGPMKMGTSPRIGVTHTYWKLYQKLTNQGADKVKKSYDNMVFLNINPSQTPVPQGFRQSVNYGYTNGSSVYSQPMFNYYPRNVYGNGITNTTTNANNNYLYKF